MIKKLPKSVKIRKARSKDISDILKMVAGLAEFEKMSDQFVATEADYQKTLFGRKRVAEALVAEGEEGLIGYAIFFSTFSTFNGKAGVWLEDLYVKEEFRRRGVGKRLLKALGEVARGRDAGRYEWCVLDWNQNAIDLYEQVGGEILDEWRIVRMDRKGIENLPDK